MTTVGVCLINQVQCTTGGCVNSSQLCDDIIDCEDGSDEFTCGKQKYHVSTSTIIRLGLRTCPGYCYTYVCMHVNASDVTEVPYSTEAA